MSSASFSGLAECSEKNSCRDENMNICIDKEKNKKKKKKREVSLKKISSFFSTQALSISNNVLQLEDGKN